MLSSAVLYDERQKERQLESLSQGNCFAMESSYASVAEAEAVVQRRTVNSRLS